MPTIAKKDLPKYVRKCWQYYRSQTEVNRKAAEERLRFYIGDQWRDQEKEKRENQGRPYITINKCKPAVDQIEGDIRQNPPGPKVLPVGEGADGDSADIFAGLIRECEYRSSAKTAYATAGKYQAAAGEGFIELATEFVNERSFAQQVTICSVEDPATIFYDPDSRLANRQDAGWAGKLRMHSREAYESIYGKRKVLEPRATQAAMGWIEQAFGVEGKYSALNEWTGNGSGPIYVAEFYLVENDPANLRMYSDSVARYDDEPAPRGVKRLEDYESRKVPRRKITKYVVDAFEVLDETEWLGTVLPLIPVLGPEIYINGKLHRLSLISGALDAQRGLNYAATTAAELAGLMPKAPWIGWKGQFDDPRWQSANSEMWAYLEVEPVHAVDPTTGQSTLLPAPQRNMWETPIQWLLALKMAFSDDIKAVTAIYDPSLGNQKGDQSGVAINALRSESSVGNFSYADNLHRAIQIVYEQIIIIDSKILSGARVQTIVRADSEHEMVTIGQEFPNEVDPASGKKARKEGYYLDQGRYAVRVTVGPSTEVRQELSAAILNEFLKIDPMILQVPGVAAKSLRAIAQGDPEILAIADLLDNTNAQNPAQLTQQLSQLQQQNKALTMLAQKMQQEIAAKLPQIEADKWKTAVNAIAGIREAEIKAGIDKSQMDIDMLEHFTGMAHETAMANMQHQNAKELGAQQAMHGSAQSAQDAAQTQAQQEAEPAGANQ